MLLNTAHSTTDSKKIQLYTNEKQERSGIPLFRQESKHLSHHKHPMQPQSFYSARKRPLGLNLTHDRLTLAHMLKMETDRAIRIDLPNPHATRLTLIQIVLRQLVALVSLVYEDHFVAIGEAVDLQEAAVVDGLERHDGFEGGLFGVRADAGGGRAIGLAVLRVTRVMRAETRGTRCMASG